MATINIDAKCDLNKPVVVRHLDGMVFSQDVKANMIRVSVFRDREPVDLSGGSVSANIIRADGATVVQTGTIEGNVCSVVLPSSAYAVPGQIAIFVKHSTSVGPTTSTIAAITGYVYKSTTDTIVDPGSVVPNVNQLLAMIEDCEEATAACIAATAAAPVVDDTAGAGDTNKVWSASKTYELKSALIDPNLTNPTMVDMKYVKYDNGTIYDTNSYVYIEASGISTYHKLHVKTYISSTVGVCFYTAQDVFISGVRNTSEQNLFDVDVDVPEGADIIRVSCLRTKRANVSIETTLKTMLDGVNTVIAQEDAKITANRTRTDSLIEKVNGSFESSINGVNTWIIEETPGYFGGYGAITPPSANNEVYTNRIKVSSGERFTVHLDLASSGKSMWLALVKYDTNGDFISRTILVNTTAQTFETEVTADSSTKEVAFSYRTFDGATFSVTQQIQAFEDVAEMKTGKVDNPYITYTGGFVVGSATAASDVNTKRAKTLPIKGKAVVTIKNAAEEGYKFSLRSWSDEPYGTMDFDSGWTSANNASYTVNGAWFAIAFYNAPSGTTDVDLDTLNSSDVEIALTKLDTDGIILGLEMKPDFVAKTVKTIAHRGDDVIAPQCVAPAYIQARKNGCEIAENDLWLSEDGEFVMWHDTTLSALGDLVDINGYLMYTDGTDYYWVKPSDNSVYTWSGTEYVASAVALSSLTRCAGANYGVNSQYANVGLNLDILKRIDFGVYRGESFAGTQILTLEEWVMLCKQLGMEIYIDRKLTYTDAQLTAAANIVKKCGMAKYTSWLALAGAQITLLRTIIPDARVGLLYHPTAELIEAYAPYNSGRGLFFNGNAKSGMTKEVIQAGLEAGFEVEVWFVDTLSYTNDQILSTIRTAVSYGVTGMTLDHVLVGDAFKDLIN